MPEGAVVTNQTSVPPSRQQTPVPLEKNSPAPSRLSSFPPYEVPEDITRTSAPDPIKVTRPKKKGAGKKKRTPLPAVGP